MTWERLGWLAAFAFAVLYNQVINAIEREWPKNDLSLITVPIGVAGVLAIALVIPDGSPSFLYAYWQGTAIKLTNHEHAVLYLLPFFVAAGIPMVAGALWRHLGREGEHDPDN